MTRSLQGLDTNLELWRTAEHEDKWTQIAKSANRQKYF